MISNVEVRISVHEQLAHLKVALGGGVEEWVLSIVIDMINIGAMLNQNLSRFQVVASSRVEER